MPTSQVTNDELLRISKIMLRLGIPCLPLVWVVQCLYLWPFVRDPLRASIKKQLYQGTNHLILITTLFRLIT
jgi:hypothetical protein